MKEEKNRGFTINQLKVLDVDGHSRDIKILVGASHLIDIPSLDLLKAVIKADKGEVKEYTFSTINTGE